MTSKVDLAGASLRQSHGGASTSAVLKPFSLLQRLSLRNTIPPKWIRAGCCWFGPIISTLLQCTRFRRAN